MILHNLYSHDISLIEYDGYHPFLEAFEQLMTQSWLCKTCSTLHHSELWLTEIHRLASHSTVVSYPLPAMLLGLIPGTSFAKFNASFTTFMKVCPRRERDLTR